MNAYRPGVSYDRKLDEMKRKWGIKQDQLVRDLIDEAYENGLRTNWKKRQ